MSVNQMSCDANVSVRLKGETKLGTKAEVKNLNSIRNVRRAIEFEIERMIALLEKGEKIYQQRLGGQGSAYAFTASPVASDGRIYFSSEDGEIFVVKAGPVFEVLATNKMNDVILATPAISQKMFIVRSVGAVYGIAKQ